MMEVDQHNLVEDKKETIIAVKPSEVTSLEKPGGNKFDRSMEIKEDEYKIKLEEEKIKEKMEVGHSKMDVNKKDDKETKLVKENANKEVAALDGVNEFSKGFVVEEVKKQDKVNNVITGHGWECKNRSEF